MGIFSGDSASQPSPGKENPDAQPSASAAEQPPSYDSASETAAPKAPPPGYGAGSYKLWPAVPHAGDYERRVEAMDAETKSKPHKKSWLKDTFGLAGPDEKEYYERRFGEDGAGSAYEQKATITALSNGGGGP